MNARSEVDRAVLCSMSKLGAVAAHYWHRPRNGRSTLRVIAFVLVLLLVIGIGAHAAEQPLAASTIVVYNKNLPDSVTLATFYAQQREITRDHLVGLDCSAEEEISREEYDCQSAPRYFQGAAVVDNAQDAREKRVRDREHDPFRGRN